MANKLNILFLTAALAAGLTACGGGGGGTDPAPGPAPAPAPAPAPSPAPAPAPGDTTKVTPTPGTLSAMTYEAGSEAMGFIQTMNFLRQQCGLPTVAQNTVLDTGAHQYFFNSVWGGFAPQIQIAERIGYALPYTTGGVAGDYRSNSGDRLTVGALQFLQAIMDPYAALNLMRQNTEIGYDYFRGQAGFINQRQYVALTGNPQKFGEDKLPMTFPCAATTSVPPGMAIATGGYDYGGSAPTCVPGKCNGGGGHATEQGGTPIVLFANPGDTLVLTSATVASAAGPVAVSLGDSTKTLTANVHPAHIFSFEAYVYPRTILQANTTYQVSIQGTVNGKAFSREFSFKTGAPIPVQLP